MFSNCFEPAMFKSLVCLRKFQILTCSCLLSVLSVFSVAYADDTEIFFAQARDTPETFPNVLFILDDSLSMKHQNKIDNLRVAMNKIISDTSNINIGLMNFATPVKGDKSRSWSEGGKLLSDFTNINPEEHRQALRNAVDTLTRENLVLGTPLVAAHYEAAMAMTGGLKSLGSGSYTSPMVGQCQNNHIILLSDGAATFDFSQGIKDSTPITACESIERSVKGSGRTREAELCGIEFAKHLYDTDHKSTHGFPGKQNITTYTIGFDIRSDYLQDVAAAGGGKYYEASDSEDLYGVFKEILTSVADVGTTFLAPATAVSQQNRLATGRDLYFSLFKPKSTPAWEGNLKKYRLGYANGTFEIQDVNSNNVVDHSTGFFLETATSFWTAGKPDGGVVIDGGAASKMGDNALEGSKRRRVFTYLGDINKDGPESLYVEGNHSNEVHEKNRGIKNNHLGGAASNGIRDNLLRWIRGYDVKDEDGDGVTNDVRAYMGDPLHSTPAVVNYTDDRSTVFVGTNEGFLHAIDTKNGHERYSFMPKELLKNIRKLYIDDRTVKHPYGLDGDITVWHDDGNRNGIVDGKDKAYLYIGMRRGGRDYYAFDVTNPIRPLFLWQIEGGKSDFVRLGQTWSKPSKSKLNIDGENVDVLIFGGGYNPNQDSNKGYSRRTDNYGNAIYIVNALTGDLIWAAKHNEYKDLDYSVPSNVRVMDVDGNGLADRMYVGDMGGQLWRFDINQYSKGGRDMVEGGVLAELAGNNNADSRRFYNAPDVALINHQGHQFMSVSIGSGWRAHPLDETTNDKFFMVRDNNPFHKPDGYGKHHGSSWQPINIRDLINVTSRLKKSPADIPFGWYIDMEESGEKVLSKSITVNNQLLFTSYQPGSVTSVCEASVGSGSAYVVSVVNGDPVMNLSGGGRVGTPFTKQDRKKPLALPGIPPSPTAIISEAGGEGRLETGIMIGTESLEAVNFGQLTYRTYWLDQQRGPQTPAEIIAEN